MLNDIAIFCSSPSLGSKLKWIRFFSGLHHLLQIQSSKICNIFVWKFCLYLLFFHSLLAGLISFNCNCLCICFLYWYSWQSTSRFRMGWWMGKHKVSCKLGVFSHHILIVFTCAIGRKPNDNFFSDIAVMTLAITPPKKITWFACRHFITLIRGR